MPYIEKQKELRLHLKWSQAKLAREAGIDRGTVSRSENGYFVNDVSCASLKQALEKGAVTAKVHLPAVLIASGGKNGEMPSKGKKLAAS